MATELITNDSNRVDSFFNSLEDHKCLLATCTDLYTNIKAHFSSIQENLTQKSQALDSKIESFDTRVEQTLESLSQRENAIQELESSEAARIEEKKNLAVSEMVNSQSVTSNLGFIEMVGLYCRRMDVNQLLKYLMLKKKEALAMRSGMVEKMVEEAVDVLALMVDGLEEFVKMKEAKFGLADMRWACGILIQELFDNGGGFCVKGVKGTPTIMVERALKVVNKWKQLMEREQVGDRVGASEGVMFLQVVLLYGLKENFEEKYLIKLVMDFAAKKEMAKISIVLGLGEKIGDIIEELMKTGKEIEAIYFVYESDLTDRFPPLDLLKSYLRTSRKNATAVLKEGNYNAAATDKASTMELNSITSIIKCVEDFNLESEFPLDSMRKRVPQLEKLKADKRKTITPFIDKPSNKRGSRGGVGVRRSGGGRGGAPPPSSRPAKSGRFSNTSPSVSHRSISHSRYATAPFSHPSRSMYEAAAPPLAAASYGGSVPQQYSFGIQDVGATTARSGGAAYDRQTAYGAYEYTAAAAVAAAAAPSAYPTYQP